MPQNDANPALSRYVKFMYQVRVLERGQFVPVSAPNFETVDEARALAERMQLWHETEYRSRVHRGLEASPPCFIAWLGFVYVH